MYIFMCLSLIAYGPYTLDMQFESDILLIIATWANTNILNADERVFDHLTKMVSIYKHSGHHAMEFYMCVCVCVCVMCAMYISVRM